MLDTGVGGDNMALARAIAESGLDGQISWLGPRHDLADRLATMAFMILPSLFGEGFPHAVAEAMATGSPPVTASFAEMAGLAASQREAMGQAVRRKVGCKFSLPDICIRYEEMFRLLSSDDFER